MRTSKVAAPSVSEKPKHTFGPDVDDADVEGVRAVAQAGVRLRAGRGRPGAAVDPHLERGRALRVGEAEADVRARGRRCGGPLSIDGAGGAVASTVQVRDVAPEV